MQQLRSFILVFIFSFCLVSFSQSQASETFKVLRAVDGDTLVIDKVGKIRLIGVDTPETKDPRKEVQYFGIEASNFLKNLVEGKNVRVEYDQAKSDRFGRVLAYVYLEDDTFVNAVILQKGYGFAYTKFPFKYKELFRGYEKAARENRRGLWANPEKISTPVLKVKKDKTSTFQDTAWSCNTPKKCTQIKTCEEAHFYLNTCKQSNLDGDGDGVPCNKLCG